MKTLKEYIIESEYAGYHEIAGLDDKQIGDIAKHEFDAIKGIVSNIKNYNKDGNRYTKMLHIPAISSTLKLDKELKTDIDSIKLSITYRKNYPAIERLTIYLGNWHSLSNIDRNYFYADTRTGVSIYSFDIVENRPKNAADIQCKSPNAVVKTYVMPIVSNFNSFCKFLKEGIKNAKYFNKETGERD